MAEIGAIASAVGVVGFAGQVVQGCSYLKSLIDDIKDAPVELQYLQAELAIIENVVKDTSTQNGNITSAGVFNPALASCLEAIAAVRKEIFPALKAMDDKTSKGKIAKGRWHQVKTAFAKQDTKKKLERLSRAKDTLVAAQMRISLNQTEKIEELGESALTKMDKLGISIDKIDATSKQNLASTASFQELLATLQADSVTSSGLLHLVATSSREFEPGIGRIVNGVSAIGTQLAETRTGISDLQAKTSALNDVFRESKVEIKAEIGRVGFQVAALHTQSTAMISNTIAEHTKSGIVELNEQILGQIRAMPQQYESMFRHVLNTEMSEALRKHFDTSRHGGSPSAQTVQPNPRLNEQGLEIPTRKLPRNISSKPRYRKISSSAYDYHLFRVFVQRFGSVEDSGSSKIIDPSEAVSEEPSVESMDKTLLMVRIFLRLGFYNRIFEYRRNWHACRGTIDRNLRAYNVVALNSPIFEALRNADIQTIQVLFKNRLASPFDVDEYGSSLLETSLTILAFSSREFTLDQLRNLFDIVGLLLKWDTTTHQGPWLFFVFAKIINRLRPFNGLEREDFGDVLRRLADSYAEDLYISQDRDFHGIEDFSDFVTLDLMSEPLGSMLITKDRWELDWVASICGESLRESDFQISNEPEGKVLREMLRRYKNGSCFYYPQAGSGISYEWPTFPARCHFMDHQLGLAPMHCLLTMISKFPNCPELVRGSFNRLVILLKDGWDAHFGAQYPSPQDCACNRYTRCLVPLSRYALWTNTAGIWEEALRQGGYSDFEIMDIFDSDLYLGVPDLLQGVAYVTQEECLAGFINQLLTKEYPSIDIDLAERETHLSHWNIKYLIRKSKEVFSRRKLPGAWPEEEKTTQKIEPGENMEFDDMMREYGIPWKVGDDKGAEAEYLTQRRKDMALKRYGKGEAEVTEMNEDEQEYALSQSNDETDAGADFERTIEWLAESWNVL